MGEFGDHDAPVGPQGHRRLLPRLNPHAAGVAAQPLARVQVAKARRLLGPEHVIGPVWEIQPRVHDFALSGSAGMMSATVRYIRKVLAVSAFTAIHGTPSLPVVPALPETLRVSRPVALRYGIRTG